MGKCNKLRREAGRLDAWLRKKSGGQNRGKGRGKGNRRGQKTREKKEDSGPMTLGDISGLLAGMGTESSSKRTRKVSSKKAECAKWATLGAHRGTRSQFKKKE